MPENLYLITGSDSAAIAETAGKLVREHAGEDADPFALDVVREGDDVSAGGALNQLVRSVLSPPFFGARKTVWLRDFSGFAQEPKKGDSGALANAFEELIAVIEKGIGDDILLIMSGPGINKSKRLFKRCRDAGKVIERNKPDIKDRNWQRQVAGTISERGRARGLRLTSEMLEHLVYVVGTETGRIEQELEKLAVFAQGHNGQLSLEDVYALCHGDGEIISWAVREALGRRNVPHLLDVVDTLLRSERDPDGAVIGLVLQSAGHIRSMLQARVLMQQEKIRSAEKLLGFLNRLGDAEKATFKGQGLEVATFHPYRAKMIAEQALNFSGPELIEALTVMRDTYHSCVSSRTSNRVVFEHAMVKICG